MPSAYSAAAARRKRPAARSYSVILRNPPGGACSWLLRPTCRMAEPMNAGGMSAGQTIAARIAGLIDSKAGLAARALDGSDQEVSSSADVQLGALVALLTDTLRASFGHGNALGS